MRRISIFVFFIFVVSMGLLTTSNSFGTSTSNISNCEPDFIGVLHVRLPRSASGERFVGNTYNDLALERLSKLARISGCKIYWRGTSVLEHTFGFGIYSNYGQGRSETLVCYKDPKEELGLSETYQLKDNGTTYRITLMAIIFDQENNVSSSVRSEYGFGDFNVDREYNVIWNDYDSENSVGYFRYGYIDWASLPELDEIPLVSGSTTGDCPSPVVDNCPDDPNKTEPGICGCGSTYSPRLGGCTPVAADDDNTQSYEGTFIAVHSDELPKRAYDCVKSLAVSSLDCRGNIVVNDTDPPTQTRGGMTIMQSDTMYCKNDPRTSVFNNGEASSANLSEILHADDNYYNVIWHRAGQYYPAYWPECTEALNQQDIPPEPMIQSDQEPMPDPVPVEDGNDVDRSFIGTIVVEIPAGISESEKSSIAIQRIEAIASLFDCDLGSMDSLLRRVFSEHDGIAIADSMSFTCAIDPTTHASIDDDDMPAASTDIYDLFNEHDNTHANNKNIMWVHNRPGTTAQTGGYFPGNFIWNDETTPPENNSDEVDVECPPGPRSFLQRVWDKMTQCTPSTTPLATCKDPDNKAKPPYQYKKGSQLIVTPKPRIPYKDTCKDSRYLVENSCLGGSSTPSFETIDCKTLGSNYACVKDRKGFGACKEKIVFVNPKCRDGSCTKDNGVNSTLSTVPKNTQRIRNTRFKNRTTKTNITSNKTRKTNKTKKPRRARKNKWWRSPKY